ncbi:hypothetical protein P153DRAFT_427700 [Dothidotthia symphoricarpi CBS 119687]|uniref:Uncharacterized protein n=1 Tax=Dothidotthia symphoricarpi CBS 119687 TaxID=1392245 RepID=A0A6A6AQG8_9PLEO|nr:uncharacterized protein P153DRAFT_427700 [Dothidotthia symphoricarpi CBS 119687]KAF2133776.1 hypothetical protein P153DRAFT_427700 [Dothidotthia symphoricarpi CBS 119687]
MPFHDKEWEDLQRDCDFFPAYTDYIYGLDTRPHVRKEPGLHPQLNARAQFPRPAEHPSFPAVSTSQFQSYSSGQGYSRWQGSAGVQQHRGLTQAPSQGLVGESKQLLSRVQPAMGTFAVQPDSVEGTKRRRLLNASQQRLTDTSSSPTASQQLLRDCRQLDGPLQGKNLTLLLVDTPDLTFRLPATLPTAAHQNVHAPATLSDSTKDHIRTFIPKVLHCLDIMNSPSFSQAQKDVAHAWVAAFRATLPHEVREYVNGLVTRLYASKCKGRTDTGGVKSGVEEQERVQQDGLRISW